MSIQPRTAAVTRDDRAREFVTLCADGVWCVTFGAGIEVGLPPEAQVACMLADGRVTEANEAAARVHGAARGSLLVGRTLGDMLGTGPQEVAELLGGFVARRYQAEQAGRLSLTGVVEGRKLVRLWGVDRRSSVGQHLDGRLRETQKLAAVGQVATAIAHDFNNLLTAILGYSEIVRDTLGPEHACASDLDQVLSAGRRAEGVARQLLSFGSTQRRRTPYADLNQVVTAFVPLLKRLLGDEIELELSCAAVPAVVGADRGQLELVLMNLAANARDAMQGAGRLTIAVEAHGHPGTPRASISLAVADSGPGVPDEVAPYIFEPFYTTRPGGIGLGLATVRDVVAGAGGTVEVSRADGGGAKFRVRLPAAAPGAGLFDLPIGRARSLETSVRGAGPR